MIFSHNVLHIMILCGKWKIAVSLAYIEMLSLVCLAGSRRKHQRERGGFLRADAAVCIERGINMFPARPVLHLPQPPDFTSATSQDRSSLTCTVQLLDVYSCTNGPVDIMFKAYSTRTTLSTVTGDMMDVEFFVETFTKWWMENISTSHAFP